MSDKYGVDAFEEMIDSLWKNKKELFSEDYVFDYPDYGGIPRKISNKLRSDAVDVIQDQIEMYKDNPPTKSKFRKDLREALFLLSK